MRAIKLDPWYTNADVEYIGRLADVIRNINACWHASAMHGDGPLTSGRGWLWNSRPASVSAESARCSLQSPSPIIQSRAAGAKSLMEVKTAFISARNVWGRTSPNFRFRRTTATHAQSRLAAISLENYYCSVRRRRYCDAMVMNVSPTLLLVLIVVLVVSANYCSTRELAIALFDDLMSKIWGGESRTSIHPYLFAGTDLLRTCRTISSRSPVLL